jgi:hypothetical protein
MQKLVQQIRHLVTGQDTTVPDMPLNRVAQCQSHDRALAAFKAEQLATARRARRTPDLQDRIGV